MRKLFIIAALFLTCASNADNLGIDYGFGPNQIPSYGMDYTFTSGVGYIDPQIMINKQMISPQVSFGIQVADINAGLVAAAISQHGSVSGLGGIEIGITDNLSETFYVKENNQLLRDNNAGGNFGITLSTGINF